MSTATLGVTTSELSEDGHLVLSLGRKRLAIANAIARATPATVFSLKLSNTIRYLNLPSLGFKNTYGVTSVALVAKFWVTGRGSFTQERARLASTVDVGSADGG